MIFSPKATRFLDEWEKVVDEQVDDGVYAEWVTALSLAAEVVEAMCKEKDGFLRGVDWSTWIKEQQKFRKILLEEKFDPGSIVFLYDVAGIARKSGTDGDGNNWIEFEVDSLAEQEPGECSICGTELWAGWVCTNGGSEVCSNHVVWVTEGYKLEERG